MQFIKSIESSLELKPLRVKIELFIFPLLTLALIYFFIFEVNYETPKKTPIKLIDKSNIKMKKTPFDVLKDIENFALKEEIYLEKISNDNKKLLLDVSGSFKKRMKLFNYIENYNSFSKIKSFELDDNILKIEVTFDKFYKKTTLDISKELEQFEEEQKNYNLIAIVDNKALINSKWFNKNETIDSLKILEIKPQFIVLGNRFKKIVLRLHKNE